MKKKYINRLLLGLAVLTIIGCNKNKANVANHDDPYALEIDSSLSVLLKPTNQEIVSTLPTVTPTRSAELFSAPVSGYINYDTKSQTTLATRVGGRIERLYVKYNYQSVNKGQVIMEIYSPELAAAQRELLMIAASGSNSPLLQNAKQRLYLLGMSSGQVSRLISTRKVSYRIPVYSTASGYLIEQLDFKANNASMNVAEGQTKNPMLLREGQYVTAGQTLFTVYQSQNLVAEFALPANLASFIKKGSSVLINAGNSEKTIKGSVGLLEPVLKNGTQFSLAKVYLTNRDYRPGQLVKAQIPIFVPESWWLPKAAVWISGTQAIVFKKEKGVFVPKNIKIGVQLAEKIQLLAEIKDWEIAANAYYLIDNESFIRPQNTK